MRVVVEPVPEGVIGDYSRPTLPAGAFDAAVLQLEGSPLPAAVAQGCDCSYGGYVTVFLSDGRTALYGPCILPTAVSAVVKELGRAGQSG